MPAAKHPGRVEPIHCSQCQKEIPRSAAFVSELKDQVLFFCGVECYEKWRKQRGEA